MGQNHKGKGRSSTKRPSQTLDLKADEVKEDVKKTSKTASGNSNDEAPKLSKTTDQSAFEKDKTSSAIDAAFQAETEVEENQVSSTPASSRGSFFMTLMAAGLGAAVVLVGQQFMPRLVSQGELLSLESLSGKIDKIETQIEQNTTKKDDQRFEELSQKLAALPDQSRVMDRLQVLETTLDDLGKAAKAGDQGIEGLAALATKMGQIESNVAKDLETFKQSLSRDVKQDVLEVTKNEARQEALSSLESIKLNIESLGKRVASIEARANQLVLDVDGFSRTLDGIRLKTVSRDQLQSEVQGLKSDLADVNSELETIKSLEQKARDTARRSALALAFSNLKRAMERGDGFVSELQAVRRLTAGEAEVQTNFEQLSKFASVGISSDRKLLQSLPDVATEAISAESDVKDQTTWDKIVSQARKSFRYRRTGNIEGDTTEAVLARMEHKFKQGQLEDVISEAKALSPKARQMVDPWLAKLEARLMVEQAMFKLEDQLLSSLEPQKN